MQSLPCSSSLTARPKHPQRNKLLKSVRSLRFNPLVVRAEAELMNEPEVSKVNVTRLTTRPAYFVSFKTAGGKTTEQDKYTVTNGYGQASGVTARATRGAQVTVKVDISVTATSEKSFQSSKEKAEKLLNEDEKKHLNENYAGYGAAAGWFSGFFGVIGGGGYNHNRNETREYDLKDNENKEKIEEVVRTLTNSTIRLEGSVVVTGDSYDDESVGRIYVETTTITTANGETKHILSCQGDEGVLVLDDKTGKALPNTPKLVPLQPPVTPVTQSS